MGIIILHYIFTRINYSNEKKIIRNERNNKQSKDMSLQIL